MNFFVDVQGFKDHENNFIVKEFAMVPEIYNHDYDDDGYLSIHYIISPPYSLQKLPQKNINNINWITQNYHGLNWNSGTIKLYELKKIIYDKLFNVTGPICWNVKGGEKIIWLSNFLATIYNNQKFIVVHNVEDSIYQSWPTLSILKMKYPQVRHCNYHNHQNKKNKLHGPMCSKQNVKLMRLYNNLWKIKFKLI